MRQKNYYRSYIYLFSIHTNLCAQKSWKNICPGFEPFTLVWIHLSFTCNTRGDANVAAEILSLACKFTITKLFCRCFSNILLIFRDSYFDKRPRMAAFVLISSSFWSHSCKISKCSFYVGLKIQKQPSIDNLQISCSALVVWNLEKYPKGNLFLVMLHVVGLKLY